MKTTLMLLALVLSACASTNSTNVTKVEEAPIIDYSKLECVNVTGNATVNGTEEKKDVGLDYEMVWKAMNGDCDATFETEKAKHIKLKAEIEEKEDSKDKKIEEEKKVLKAKYEKLGQEARAI